jgi:hypothetical protein
MTKFKTLVRELDEPTLEQLFRQVAAEIEQRRQKTAIQLKDIHPRMSPEEKAQATLEIARVLRERG